MNDLISVIIPVYLAEKTLKKCVASVQNQIFHNFEMIIIDDGSFDASAEMCDALVQNDNRITVVHIPNGGAGNARNIGIELSFGKFLAFVDSDDFIDENMLFDLFRRMDADNSDVCSSDLSEEPLSECFVTRFSHFDMEKIFYLLSQSLMYGPCQKLYRTSIIKNNCITFPTDLNYGEDMVFNIRHMYHIDTISYIHKNYYHYIRDNQDSLSKKVRWNMFDNDMIFEKQLQDLFIKKNIFKGKIKEYDAYRILGVAYDSLFLLTRKDCPFDHKEITQYIKKIVHHELVQWSLSVADASGYAQWMIHPMKQRQARMIQLLCFIKRKTA